MKIWVQRAANYVRRVDNGPYGNEEEWVPKDMWWEEVEMQEYVPLNWEAAYKVTRKVGVDKNGDLPLDENDIVEWVEI